MRTNRIPEHKPRFNFVCVCVYTQTPGRPDAGVSSLPHLWVLVHGPEEVPGLHPVWPVHGPHAGQGTPWQADHSLLSVTRLPDCLRLPVVFSPELPLPDPGGNLLLPLSPGSPPGPETPEPTDRQQGRDQTGGLWLGPGLWRTGQGLYPRGETRRANWTHSACPRVFLWS